MTDREVNNNGARRRLLKSIVAGGGVLATGKLLPENWARPLVQSVVLPAHAQTSPGGPTGNFGVAIDLTSNDRSPSILDHFVPTAHAAPLPGSAKVGNVSYDAFWTVRDNDASICGQAWYLGENATSIGGVVGRSGNSLDDFSEFVGPVTLSFTNQEVSEDRVRFTASTTDSGNPSQPAVAPAGGPGCPEDIGFNSSTSSPYPDDDFA